MNTEEPHGAQKLTLFGHGQDQEPENCDQMYKIVPKQNEGWQQKDQCLSAKAQEPPIQPQPQQHEHRHQHQQQQKRQQQRQ